jgi:hypothetical protein
LSPEHHSASLSKVVLDNKFHHLFFVILEEICCFTATS